jgi:hypothetical protein
MPARNAQTTCPNCRQPVVVEVEQLFDLNDDPQAKQRLLSGNVNMLHCPYCGFQGQHAVTIVYHDPNNEYLLTFVPHELGLPMDAQEQVIGPLINQIVARLPQEKRKAYLLTPRTMLTMQGLVETILEADGITKEMLETQQQRLNLLQRLSNVSEKDVLIQIAQQEDALIDQEFFNLQSQLIASALANGDEGLAQRLKDVQEQLLTVTTYGRQLQEQSQEVEAAVQDLQDLGESITREKLLELVVKAPNDTRLQALVSLARGGMDYQFFQLLSDRIDRARSTGRSRLVELRTKLLDLTREYDESVEVRKEELRAFLESVLESENIREILIQNSPAINNLFIQVVQSELEAARQTNDLDRGGKLQKVMDVIEELSAPPQEVEIINNLLSIPKIEDRQEFIESLSKETLQAVMDMLAGAVSQVESSGDLKLAKQVKEVYRQVLRHSMRISLKS